MACAIVECDRTAYRRGWCNAHYQRWSKYGDPTAGGRTRLSRVGATCLVETCDGPAFSAGYCNFHYGRFRKWGDPLREPATVERQACSVAGCGKQSLARGWCARHYGKWRRNGDPLFVSTPETRRTAPERPRRDRQGYVVRYLPEHPNAQKSGRVLEHVVVMAETVGRPLTRGESVHHKNGIRDDNDPSNLELWTSMPQPSGQRVRDLVDYANRIIERYGDDPTLYP